MKRSLLKATLLAAFLTIAGAATPAYAILAYPPSYSTPSATACTSGQSVTKTYVFRHPLQGLTGNALSNSGQGTSVLEYALATGTDTNLTDDIAKSYSTINVGAPPSGCTHMEITAIGSGGSVDLTTTPLAVPGGNGSGVSATFNVGSADNIVVTGIGEGAGSITCGSNTVFDTSTMTRPNNDNPYLSTFAVTDNGTTLAEAYAGGESCSGSGVANAPAAYAAPSATAVSLFSGCQGQYASIGCGSTASSATATWGTVTITFSP